MSIAERFDKEHIRKVLFEAEFEADKLSYAENRALAMQQQSRAEAARFSLENEIALAMDEIANKEDLIKHRLIPVT